MNDLDVFKKQIEEDITLIKEKLGDDETNTKSEYLFNYWVLENIYKLDLELCKSQIVDYKDGGLDCFVFNEDDKDLFLIQNKYYNKSSLSNSNVTDFITRPIALLKENKYKRSKELQDIYNDYKDDPDFRVYFHLYCTSDKKSDDIGHIISSAKKQNLNFDLFTLKNISDKYYSLEGYEERKQFSYKIPRANKRHVFHVNNQEHDIKEVSDVVFVQTSIANIFDLLKSAEDKQYPIFEKNIREYLGSHSKNSINRKIFDTLLDEKERKNFVLYNNGITIICDRVKDVSISKGYTEVTNPQIVNGCQTVSTIKEFFIANDEVLSDLRKLGNSKSSISIMLKIIALKSNEDKSFYTNIVRYTNSQNAVNEKLFSSATMPFEKIKENLLKKSILLCIKQSDKNTYKNNYKSKLDKDSLIDKANKNYGNGWMLFKTFTQLNIDLEKMLQILLSFYKEYQGGYFAYTKKSKLLDKSSRIYEEFSCNVNANFTIKGISNLIGLYRYIEIYRKENDREKEKDQVTFLSIGFLSYFITEYAKQDLFEYINSVEFDSLIKFFNLFVKPISEQYFIAFKKKNDFEYNNAIKKEIDKTLLDDKITGAIYFQKYELEKLGFILS